MQRKLDRFVMDRENNVVWVDFDRDPDPPAPKFPGAGGLRQFGGENTGAAANIPAVAPGAAAGNLFAIDPSQRSIFSPAFNEFGLLTRGVGYG